MLSRLVDALRRPWALTLAGALVLAVLAFAAGRWAAPPRVETRTQEVVRWRERLVEVEKKVEVRVAQEARTRFVYRDRAVAPDGTVRERELEREESDTRSSSSATAELGREYSAAGEHQVEAERREERARPAWRVGVLAGAALQAPGSPVVGPLVERRLVGPLSVGAWALVPTAPGAPADVGVALVVEF